MSGRTISEKILGAHCGRDVRAGETVICDVDLVLGTDASAPMAIDYFRKMQGTRLWNPERVLFALDHYSPPSTEKKATLHTQVREFIDRYGGTLCEVGDGISHQIVVEKGLAGPGDLVIGADSHTVTCGALNCFATGVGSSDLAAAMVTGKLWFRVPETIKVILAGRRVGGQAGKDIALALVKEVGADGANYKALEFHGEGVDSLSLEERLVVCNFGPEMDAKAAIFPGTGPSAVAADNDAEYARTVTLDLSTISPQIALPHAPDNVVPLAEALGTPVQMVFLGTCAGGRISDFHAALAVLEHGGGSVAPGVQLVVTPASRVVELALEHDGTLARFREMGAIVTTAGCGACCGTSGVIPGDGMNVISTANRNFKARMGNGTASIYLASPAACAAAALTGRISLVTGAESG